MSTSEQHRRPAGAQTTDDKEPADFGGDHGDSAIGLVNELEQILRSEAETPNAGPDDDPIAAHRFADELPTPDALWDDLPSEYAFDEPEPELEPEPLEAGPDEADFEPPRAAFWQGEPTTREVYRGPAEPARLLQRRDIAIIILLVALIATGATYSATQLTGTQGTPDSDIALADDPPAPAEAEPAEPEQNEIARADIAGRGDEEPPIEPADPGTPEPAFNPPPAAEIAEVAEPVAEEPAPDLADPAPLTPRPVEAVILPASPALAFADPGIGGPFVRDPLEALAAPEAADPAEIAETPIAPVAEDPPPAEIAIAEDPGSPQPATTPATANSYVNMRAGPDNDAAVIGVIATGATVDVVNCNFWCEVIVDGVEGWIYQDFLDLEAR